MKPHTPARYALLVAASLLVLLAVSALWPSGAHAAIPEPALPGWLHDVLVQIEIAMVKTLQDTARVGGVLMWGILKVCGMVGLFGNDFSVLFGTVVTEALNAVITGQVHTLIRGSLMVSLGLFGLSLLARPFWPDLKLVSFQRAAIWGIVIQAYLLNAPAIYTELETWRVDLSEQVADAVSTGAVPGCSGNVVQVLLCITGTSSAEVLEPRLTVLPDHLPYGGAESVHDLYDHCAYNPPVLYASPACDQDSPTGDPWQVLVYAQDALGIQLLSLIVGLLILAYGILQISLGLAAGMMFVLFPVAAIFAFYLPLESFPAGVIRNYISIFLKSVVLLTLAGVVIRLFSIATGSLAAMAAVALVDLLLCLVMAKEALASLLGSIGFIGTSVGNLGAAVGLGGAAGAAMMPSSESRVAASMIGGGAVAQILMGAPHPYGGSQGRTVLGTTGSVAGAPARGARAALSAAMAAGTGGAGALVGMVAATRATGSSNQGSGLGSLALMGNAATTILGRNAGRGFMTGAGVVAARKVRKEGQTAVTTATSPSTQPSTTLAQPSRMRPTSVGAMTSMPAGRRALIPTDPVAGVPISTVPLQDLLLGNSTTDLGGWSTSSARRIRQTATKLEPASPDAENAVLDLAMAGHRQAQWWDHEGRSPVLADGSLSPRFVEEVLQLRPEAATTLSDEMAASNIPSDQQLGAGEAVALGVTTQRTIPAQQAQQGFARAVEAMEHERDLGTAMQRTLGVSSRAAFGERAPQAASIVRQMKQAGLGNSLGSQLVETVGEKAQLSPNLTAQQFREANTNRVSQWDQATGNPEATDRIVDSLIGLGPASAITLREIPLPPRGARGQRTAQPRPRTPKPVHIDPQEQSEGRSVAVTQPDPALAASLREWRLAEAQQEGRKAFYVFSDATLQRIADARPQTLEELEAVKGIGPKKLAQYGQDVLAITRTESEVKGVAE